MDKKMFSVSSPIFIPETLLHLDLDRVAQSASNLSEYIDSWTVKDGLNGIIATWWASSVETIEPHPMNHAPMMHSYASLHHSGIDGDWGAKCKHLADSLLAKKDSSNLLVNGWGDLPDAPISPVIGFSAVGALYSAASIDKCSNYQESADEILKAYQEKFSSSHRLYHGVANQSARWVITLLQRYKLTGDLSDLDQAVLVAEGVLSQQIASGSNYGAIYQGKNSDILITVYCGKCLYALVLLYELTGEKKYLDSSKKLGQWLEKQVTSSWGIFYSHQIPRGRYYDLLKKMCSLANRVSKHPSRYSKLRRLSISTWESSEYPMFIARAADSIRGLTVLAKHDSSFKSVAGILIDKLLNEQLVHGGFPNSIGFEGDPSVNSWQDVAAPTRWNAYVFQLLVELVIANNLRSLPPSSSKWPYRASINGDAFVYTESQNSVVLTGMKDSDPASVCWNMDKLTGGVEVADEWKGKLTASRENISKNRKH